MPHLLPSTGRDERRAKRPWQEKKRGPFIKTHFVWGLFLSDSTPPPVTANTFFWSLPRLHPSLVATPTCLHIHFIKPWLSSAPRSAEQAVRSCLIGPQPPSCFSTSGKVNGCLWPGKMMSVNSRQRTGFPSNCPPSTRSKHALPFASALYTVNLKQTQQFFSA